MDINVNVKVESASLLYALIAVYDELQEMNKHKILPGKYEDLAGKAVVTKIPEPVFKAEESRGRAIPMYCVHKDNREVNNSEPSNISLEQLREKLSFLSKQGKLPEVRRLINSFGVKKLSEVLKKDYAALLKAAESIYVN